MWTRLEFLAPLEMGVSAMSVDEMLKLSRQQLQWIAMQEVKAKEFEERGEQRIPCYLQIEYVFECARLYRELVALQPQGSEEKNG